MVTENKDKFNTMRSLLSRIRSRERTTRNNVVFLDGCTLLNLFNRIIVRDNSYIHEVLCSDVRYIGS